MSSKKLIISQVISGRFTNRWLRIKAWNVSTQPSWLKIMNHGIRKVIPGVTREDRMTTPRRGILYRAMANAAGSPMNSGA